MIIQLLFGWPGILIFTGLATLAAWTPNIKLMIAALIWSLPSAFYLFGGNGWIQLAALYIPLSLGVSIYLITHKKYLFPKLLMLPIYGVYGYLGFMVITQ